MYLYRSSRPSKAGWWGCARWTDWLTDRWSRSCWSAIADCVDKCHRECIIIISFSVLPPPIPSFRDKDQIKTWHPHPHSDPGPGKWPFDLYVARSCSCIQTCISLVIGFNIKTNLGGGGRGGGGSINDRHKLLNELRKDPKISARKRGVYEEGLWNDEHLVRPLNLHG